MSTETFKKRQKELARKEKREKKAARRVARANDKANGKTESTDEFAIVTEPASDHGPALS